MTRIAWILLPLALVACNSEDVGHLRNDTQQLAQHAGQALDSASVAGKVYTALSLRKGVDVKGLHVEAKEATVTISGHVGSEEEKSKVIETANDVVGVDTVVDRIQIAQDQG